MHILAYRAYHRINLNKVFLLYSYEYYLTASIRIIIWSIYRTHQVYSYYLNRRFQHQICQRQPGINVPSIASKLHYMIFHDIIWSVISMLLDVIASFWLCRINQCEYGKLWPGNRWSRCSLMAMYRMLCSTEILLVSNLKLSHICLKLILILLLRHSLYLCHFFLFWNINMISLYMYAKLNICLC